MGYIDAVEVVDVSQDGLGSAEADMCTRKSEIEHQKYKDELMRQKYNWSRSGSES